MFLQNFQAVFNPTKETANQPKYAMLNLLFIYILPFQMFSDFNIISLNLLKLFSVKNTNLNKLVCILK